MKASIIALRFLAMRDKKVMFSVRVVPVVKKLIKAETKHLKCSEAEVIERWALSHAKSEASRAILVEHAQTDPMIHAVVDAMADHPKKQAATNGIDPPRRSRRSAA